MCYSVNLVHTYFTFFELGPNFTAFLTSTCIIGYKQACALAITATTTHLFYLQHWTSFVSNDLNVCNRKKICSGADAAHFSKLVSLYEDVLFRFNTTKYKLITKIRISKVWPARCDPRKCRPRLNLVYYINSIILKSKTKVTQ